MSVFITQTTYGMRGIKMSENYNYLRELSTPQLEECCVMHNTNQSQPLKISG